jgi:GTP diphosphokinase / guanosine-3',5'-bis(diphosphate) 3'-diphosphatase
MNQNINDIGLILSALEFSAIRHRKQLRKGEEKTPYINHPIQVAKILAIEGNETDAALIAAAILHDVIEDTVAYPEEKQQLIEQIRQLFGEEVISIVLEVTDDKMIEKKERKILQIQHAAHKSDKAKKLKIADKITNVRDITIDPPVHWPLQRKLEYFDWAEKVVAGLRGVNENLETLFDNTLENARKTYSHTAE